MERAKPLSLLLTILLAACSPGTDPGTPAESLAAAPGEVGTAPEHIEWFQGSVDAAFAYAKEHGKPLFLYWGAEWCPPCHYIHSMIFAKKEFIERSRLFVPVYLDGDTESAQELGEKLGVFGYPTMIVYDADGREITRIPGGIDIAAYASVLDVALVSARPVADIVANVLDQGAALNAADCQLLAYYSWDQDNERVLAERDAVAVFSALRDACPVGSKKERTRLYLEQLARLEEAATAETDPAALTSEQREQARAQLTALAADYDLAKDNTYFVFFAAARFIDVATQPGSAERRVLIEQYSELLERMQDDASLYARDRVYTAIGRIKLAKLDAGEHAVVPQALSDETRRLVAWADSTTTDPNERQAVMNAAWGALQEAGLDAEADAMLRREIEKASQPHYFMSGLAELAQKSGHYDEAIAWLERAYESSHGQATRFQWGTDYVVGLIEMAPEDDARIEQAAVELFGELKRSADTAFYHRNTMRMQRLQQKLVDWNGDDRHRASINSIRAAVRGICQTIDVEQESRRNCEAFLAAT